MRRFRKYFVTCFKFLPFGKIKMGFIFLPFGKIKMGFKFLPFGKIKMGFVFLPFGKIKMGFYFTSINSTSKIKGASGGIMPPAP